MINGYLKKWQYELNKKNDEFAELMGISTGLYWLRMRNPYDIRLKEIMKLWDEMDISDDEINAFWREVRDEWQGKYS